MMATRTDAMSEARKHPKGSPERTAGVKTSIEIDAALMLSLAVARYAEETGGRVVGIEVDFDTDGSVSGVVLKTMD